MTSLTEAYQGNARDATSLRRLYVGAALVLLGAGISVLAVLLPTTEFFTTLVADVTTWETADHYASVRVAGGLDGVGVPMALIGVFIVFPAGRRMRAAGAIGASLCLLSVVLFWGHILTTGGATAPILPSRWRRSTCWDCSSPSGVCSSASSTSKPGTIPAAASK